MPESGKRFKAWTATDGVAFADATAAETSFTMPAKPVTITATYENIPAAKTPIGTVTLSGLIKPLVGEMPNNSITVSGTGVAVDDEGTYWGRFDSTRFSPVYDDTAVDSVVFRDGETYMFQLYLNAADGYEFTEDSKFVFAGNELPAPDMDNLSKSFAMVNPGDRTQAVIYINMNDIAHVHVAGDWNHNDTHHWHKCTAAGCDAGSDVSKLPDYAEHDFVNGLCTCGAHKHNWSADWSADTAHHWHECSADGCAVTENSGKDGYAAHDFTAGACVCGVENVITSIEISGITAPVAGETPVNSAAVDKVGTEVDEENTFWVRYDASAGRTSDTYADGTSVYNTPFRDGEIYLLQIMIKLETGYSFAADTKILYGGAELSSPDAANPTASCGAIAPDGSMARALINADGTSVPLTYTVTFDANGGTGTMAAVNDVSGEYQLPANGFTAPSGKQFKCWSVGGTEKVVGARITVAADTTVKAVWKDVSAGGGISGAGGGYFAPTVQKPVIEAGEGIKVTLSADGKTAFIETAEGYEVDSVVLNGVEKGAVTEVKGLKTGDKLEVSAKMIAPDDTDIIEGLKDYELAARSRLVTMKNGRKAVKIVWQDEENLEMDFDGVEIFRSTERYSGYGTEPFFETGKDAYYNTLIEKGTTYYYKIRGYVEIDGKRHYTDWSRKAWRTVK